MRRNWIAVALSAGALVLAGCSAGNSTGGSAAGSPAPSSAAAAAPSAAAGSSAEAAALSTWTSPLGAIVVAGNGRTVYVFDKDTPGSGTSACSGTCAALWPAVTTTSSTPAASGVTGTLGTIARSDGSRQVTLNGHPLYTFSGDSASQQTRGQGVMGIWWVVSPSGTKISSTAAASDSDSSSYMGY